MEPSPELIEGGIYVSLTAIKTSSDVMLKEKKFKWQIAVATSGQMAFLYGVAPCGELANLDKISKWSMTNSGGVDIFTLPGLCVMYKIGNASFSSPCYFLTKHVRRFSPTHHAYQSGSRESADYVVQVSNT